MNSKELLEKYPKAAEVILAHYTEIFKASLGSTDLSSEFKEFIEAQQLDFNTVGDLIDTNPRSTFDVFDANEVYIQISVDLENKCFRWSFDGGHVESNDYTSRKEAEVNAVEKAFEILNDKL